MVRSIDILIEGEDCTVTDSASGGRRGSFAHAFYGTLAALHGTREEIVVRGELGIYERQILSGLEYFNSHGHAARYDPQRKPVQTLVVDDRVGHQVV